VLLHGLGDDADTWRHVIPLLTENYRVIAPDLPGFGRSEAGPQKPSMTLFSAALLELLDQLSIQRAAWVGHSLGAMIAQSLALRHPERVERLVLISGALTLQKSRINPTILLYLLPGVGEWLYNRLRKSPQAAYATMEPYYNHLAYLPQADRDFLFQRVNQRVWSDRLRQGYLATLRGLAAWIPAQQKALPALLQNWTIPTQVVWGEKDRISPLSNALALIDLLPAARLVRIPEAGHNIPQEKPAAVAAAIG
jgi:pimeloyl-ACP methyl ester carboxylesterase